MENDIINQIHQKALDMHLSLTDAEIREFIVKAERLHWSADKTSFELIFNVNSTKYN